MPSDGFDRASTQTNVAIPILSTFSTRVDLEASGVKTVNEDEAITYPPRDYRFWLVFLALDLSTLLTALELSMISPALPTIVHDLGGSSFIWVGSAYALVATAFIPLSGGLAHTFGRKLSLLLSLSALAIGSVICGVAKSMNTLIAGRAVQGLGGGSVASLTYIIISDLVSLRERGLFNSFLSIAWAIGLGSGPIIGGSLSQAGQWRWLFYMNIPICGAAAVLVLVFLHSPPSAGSSWERLKMMDWTGIALFGASSTSAAIALTWAGVEYSWGSAQVLAPLILGLVGLVACFIYEAKLAKSPVVPVSLMSTGTALSGYLQTFIWPIIMIAVVYYLPVYWQACQLASPVRTGVQLLPLALVPSPCAVIAGLSVKKTGIYRPQLWLAWCCIIMGTGVLTVLKANTSFTTAAALPAIVGAGIGVVNTSSQFPVLAPLSPSQNALALSYLTFLRHFAQVWGVTVGGTILQNQLLKKLPAQVLGQVDGSSALAFEIIPVIGKLPQPLRDEVRHAFAASIVVIWKVLAGVAALGLVSCLLMRSLSLDGEVQVKSSKPKFEQEKEALSA